MNFEFTDLADVDHIRFHLLDGERNAVTQAQLAARCEIPLRRVQAALEAMKRSGVPIVTGSAGVWLSHHPAELRDAYRRHRNRAIHQQLNNRGRLKAIAALERYQQTRLWDAA